MTTPTIESLVSDYRALTSWEAVAEKYGVTRQAVQSRVSTALPTRDYARLVSDVESRRMQDREAAAIDAKEFEQDICKHGTMRAAWMARGLTRYAYEKALELGEVPSDERQNIIARVSREQTKLAYLALCKRYNKGEMITTTWLRAHGYRKLLGEVERHFGGFASFLAVVQSEME